MLPSSQVRKMFLDYFKAQRHTVVASSSLIPAGDPTLLFTNAGMVPFKDVFLGREKRDYTRATTSQKCMRVSGKHNDLENVGPSPRHHTFFEMLGNFSFGDYFKQDAITFAWDLLVNHYQLDPARLWFTIFQGDAEVAADEEAAELWVRAGAKPDRVRRFGRKDNFWSMGDVGPCGPCSEIHYYRGENPGDPKFNRAEFVNGDGEDTIEIWNLVFMQFNRFPVGDGFKMEPLPRPSVDTGAGLERVTAVLQGKRSNYETDLFMPILERTRQLLGHDPATMEERIASYRVIADHSRAVAFLIADGVIPGNEGRNYVLRLILRRAARHGQLLGFTEPFLTEILPTVFEIMGEPYPELVKRRDVILKTTLEEEKRFQATLKTGSALLDELIGELKNKHSTVISGPDAFKLHDTYGFALELTRDIAREYGMTVDEAGFRKAMEEQADRSRAASNIGAADTTGEQAHVAIKAELIPAGVAYDPYTSTAVETTVAGFVRDGAIVQSASVGDQVEAVLPATCFYVESGGQVGDTGRIVKYSNDGQIEWAIEVSDAIKPVPGLIVHAGLVTQGSPRVGDAVVAEVDRERRLDIMRNHTATHLLHRELRRVLGEHAQQGGSLVAPDYFRFDFTYSSAVSPDERERIEQAVNEAILADLPVAPREMGYREAVADGAMALFTEKYGDRVRVVKVGDPSNPFSQELCGGTHVQHTSQIGSFRVLSESSIGSGLRRIEAVTGHGAYKFLHDRTERLERVAAHLRATPDQVDTRVLELVNEHDAQQKEIERLRRELAQRDVAKLLDRVQVVNGISVLATQVQVANADMLREMGDWLKDKLGSGVVVLGAAIDNKPSLVVMVTQDLVAKGYDAVKLIREIARVVGGGGGGRPPMAQAGGKDASRLDEALALVSGLIAKK